MIYYTVHFFDSFTNRRATLDYDIADWDDESSEFLWNEHNWGCDCNRMSVFEDEEETKCVYEFAGKHVDRRVFIEKIVHRDGRILYQEDIESIWT